MLTITSGANQQDFDHGSKKHVIVSARVHPGETVASFIMEGFLNFLISDEASELRSKLIFKVIPMTNPDGVILGNYRCSLSGHDLNRTYLAPNKRLHPTTCAIKKMVEDITKGKSYNHLNHPVQSFIDIHGHSRKKSVFVYGPYFPLHTEKYLRVRVLAKLMDDILPMFRFYSCKFKLEKSK
jgi:murein tripeptide amidase MpaA